MKKKTLILVAHPDMAESRIHRAWASELSRHPDQITVHDLYAKYRNTNIDIAFEQELLLSHDRIVFQFPLHWYQAPSLLKKWIDEVLTYGFAWGPGGDKLVGKEFLVATSTGSKSDFYRSGGKNQFTLSEFLRPYQALANYVDGNWIPSYILYGTFYDLSDEQLEEDARAYAAYAIAPAYKASAPAVMDRLEISGT